MKLPKLPLKTRLSSLRLPQRLTKAKSLVFIAGFAVIGSILLFATRAAGPFASLEPEQGTKTTNATIGSDTAASGGQFVQFGSGAITPPPPPPTGSRCPAYPAFPDANCTGVPPGVAITTYTGSNPVIVAGTVIDGKLINGDLSICASNVTIKRSKIAGRVITGYNDVHPVCGGSGGYNNILIEDVEIDGGVNPDIGLDALGTVGFTCLRCHIHNSSGSFIRGEGITVEDSYLHDLFGESVCKPEYPDCFSHEGTITAYGGNIVIRHNNLVGNHSPLSSGGGVSSALSLYNHGTFYSSIDNVLIEKNRLETKDALYCAYGGDSGGPSDPNIATNIRFIDNVFIVGTSGTCGSGGPITGWMRDPTNLWRNNKFDKPGWLNVSQQNVKVIDIPEPN